MAPRRLAENQPASFAFTAENLAWAKERIAKYPEGRQASAVISLLWRAQEQSGGWVPQKAIEHVAEILGMAKIRVLEVATFYTMFNLAPVGTHHVQFCGTTHACCGARRRSRTSATAGSASRAMSPPTAGFPGSRSNVSAPASMLRWSRSITIITRI